MSNRRYPGYVKSIGKCKKTDCSPIRIIKSCPLQPHISKTLHKDKIFDRGMVLRFEERSLTVTDKCGHSKSVDFLLETFGGYMLIPTNLEKFCASNKFRSGDVIAVEADVESENYCTSNNALPVKLTKLVRVWKREIREVTGTVSKSIDADGQEYHRLTHIFDQTRGDPFHHIIANSLIHPDVTIIFAINNILGVSDVNDCLTKLLEKTITVKYVDDGKETANRCGLPIVITDLRINDYHD